MSEVIRKQAADAADENGMVAVMAKIDGVRDNGKTYHKGDTLHMHKDLVPAHVAAGQVDLVAGSTGLKPVATEKQQATPADKQFTGGKNK